MNKYSICALLALITSIPAATAATVVTVSPATVTMGPGKITPFSALIAGSANTGVIWSISPAIGWISSAGWYHSPLSIGSPQTVTVTATSIASNTVSGIASVSLQSGATGQTAVPLASFPLPELFGVAWPEQPIEFRYDGGRPPQATTRMMGPNGTEVPYQWVSSCSDVTATRGCIVVRNNLPASSNYTWTLQSGIPPAAVALNPVQSAQVGANWEITNGLTGVRIRTTTGNPGPANLAPIQGIQLADGTWTGAGSSPNLLYSESNGAFEGCIGCALQTPMYTTTGYSAVITESGPLKVVVRATYTFNRPKYIAGSTLINNSGPGHYTVILTMYANSKAILIDEDSDMQFTYYVPLYQQLTPDIARYRGQDAVNANGSSDPRCGYETPAPVTAISGATPATITAAVSMANGQRMMLTGVQGNTALNGNSYAKTAGYPAGQFGLFGDAALTRPVSGAGALSAGAVVKPAYRGASLSPMSDGFEDLTYTGDRPAAYGCSTTTYRKLLTDYPAATHASGWYVEMYRSTGGGLRAPVVGFFTGRASQQINSANGPSMPGMYSSNSHWITGKQDAGIQVDNLLRGPGGAVTPLIHRNWGIWVGTQYNLYPASLHQPIADEQNSLTGINLSRLYTYQLVYPDPPGGWTWQFLSPGSANRLISQVRDGTALCGSTDCEYNLLHNSETSVWGHALLDMWKGNSASAVQTALNGASQLAQTIVQILASGDNHFNGPFGYYQLGLYTSPETAVLNAILMDSNTTPAQKTTAKAALALFGCLFWDDDWFPIDNSSGESFGLSNQVQQYLQFRTQSVAAVPAQPYLHSKLPTALGYPAADLAAYFSPTGAPAGSTHYQSAFFEPLILNYLNLALNGSGSMSDPRWAAYANWELSIQTPPEPRFGNLRKGYSNGDGNTEADVRPGLLGTALYPLNPALASNLMWAWQQSNSSLQLTEDSQFGTTITAIDSTLPAIAPVLSSVNIPGYHSVERHNFGTPNETALWFINGGFYSSAGHRHADDGQVTIYAHNAPLAIDWNANLYNPQTPGRFMHNSIVFDSELSHAWSADNTDLSDADALMANPTNTEFAAFKLSTTSTGSFTAQDGTQWQRTVRTLNFNPSFPVIYVHDSFSGPGAITGKTLTWNLMASGQVGTPAGPVHPTTRLSAGCQSPAGALPSNGTVSGLPVGLSEFQFTGALWPQHPAKGINWDIFTLAPGATQQFLIGNWGHGCHTSRESGEYQTANGAPFAEVQDILRIHDAGPFTTMILPYQKTQAPASRTVSTQACGIQIVQGSETSCFNDSAATYSNGSRGILTTFDSSPQTAFGITATGGPQEIVIQPTTITWTLGGIGSGARNLTLQGTWYPDHPIGPAGSSFSYNYAGGAQAAPATIVFSQTP